MEIQGWPKTCTLTLLRPQRRWRSLAEILVSISPEFEIFGMMSADGAISDMVRGHTGRLCDEINHETNLRIQRSEKCENLR
jgi:hypothetical protein